MSKPLISSMRVSYKAGFSSALKDDTVSGYIEASYYQFDANKKPTTLRKAFYKGYLDATRILREVRYELLTKQ